MKKVLIGCGVSILLLIILIVGGLIFVALRSKEVNAEATPFVKEIIPSLSTWSLNDNKKYFHSDLLFSTDDEKFELLFKKMATIGKLKSVGEPKLVNSFTKSPFFGKSKTYTTYTVPAEYENGKATITLRLVYEEGDLKILNFNLNSDYFLK